MIAIDFFNASCVKSQLYKNIIHKLEIFFVFFLKIGSSDNVKTLLTVNADLSL